MSRVSSQKYKQRIQNSGYVVQKIIGYKVKNGQQLFKLLWQGFSKDKASWEPIENLNNGGLEMQIERWREKQRRKKVRQPYEAGMKLNKQAQNQKPKKVQLSDELSQNQQKTYAKLIQYCLDYVKSPQYLEEQRKKTEKEQNSPNCQKQTRDEIELKANGQFVQQISKVSNQGKQESKKQIQNQDQQELNINEYAEKTKKIKKIVTKTTYPSPTLKKNVKKRQEPNEEIATTFQELPITKIIGKIQFRGETLYQVDLGYKGLYQLPIIFHENYVRAYWPSLLNDFEEEKSEMQQEYSIEQQN